MTLSAGLSYYKKNLFKNNMDTLGIEPNTSRMLSERDNQLHHVPFKISRDVCTHLQTYLLNAQIAMFISPDLSEDEQEAVQAPTDTGTCTGRRRSRLAGTPRVRSGATRCVNCTITLKFKCCWDGSETKRAYR